MKAKVCMPKPVTTTGHPEHVPHLEVSIPNRAPPTTSPTPMQIPDSPIRLLRSSPMALVNPILDEYTDEKKVNDRPVYTNVSVNIIIFEVKNNLKASLNACQAATSGFSLGASGMCNSLSALLTPSAGPRLTICMAGLIANNSASPVSDTPVSTLKTRFRTSSLIS